ncbi:hypothetical protein KAI60_05085 [Candidatus Bathyarchaeota archaeon]|nr:hypothetical protein [Candidatus Bathyarchaeota archaeon]
MVALRIRMLRDTVRRLGLSSIDRNTEEGIKNRSLIGWLVGLMIQNLLKKRK